MNKSRNKDVFTEHGLNLTSSIFALFVYYCTNLQCPKKYSNIITTQPNPSSVHFVF